MSQIVSTSSPSSSRALVVPDNTSTSFIKPKRKEVVLDEDSYIDSLSEIIQRDFYPDLPKLQAQLEWMKAEQVNDVEKMRELQQRMLTIRRPTTGRATPGMRTPRNAQTPKGFETPTGATPAHASASHASAHAHASTQDDGSAPVANTNMSLDKFVDKHTSEDDASFVTIMEKQSEKHQEKYGWVTDKTNEAALMLIEATKQDETGHFPALQTWNYTVRNQLMYVPDGPSSLSSLMPPPPGPPKAILHRNTRISKGPSRVSSSSTPDAVWASISASSSDPRLPASARKSNAPDPNGKVDLANLLGTPKPTESPKVGGYGFLATPSPAPGVDMSPITTWGRLDGTPLLLDNLDTPLDLTPGPSFKLPETPRREEIAMKLADKANKSQKDRIRMHDKASPYARPSASPARGSTVSLSAAGRTLMERKMNARKGTVGGADMQLRASYSPAHSSNSGINISSKGRGGLVTPSPLPSPSPAPSPRTTKAPTPSHASSITDNLLDIPSSSGSSSSKKGKSITDDLLSI